MSLFSRMFEKSRKPQEAAKPAEAVAVPAVVPTAASGAPIRLVVWGLDGIFWPGALQDGPVAVREEMCALVRALAARGIASSICARHRLEDVEPALTGAGIWTQFVQPSLALSPVGPRLAALAAALDVPAESILFVDDKPRNRAQTAYFVPGIRVGGSDSLADLLEQAVPDADPATALERLRARPPASSPGDVTPFLRTLGITVTIDYDIVPHIDRAVALIKRADALNFTGLRLRPDPVRAAAHLRGALSRFSTQAGLVHVRDNVTDYGYCGFYLLRTTPEGRRLTHFCFSDDLLDLGVETWLYRRLGRPDIAIDGTGLPDILADRRPIDWIGLSMPDAPSGQAPIDSLYASGGSDLAAIVHYFDMLGVRSRCQSDLVRDGAALALAHSVIARYAIDGIGAAALDALLPLGFVASDFTPLPAGPKLWLLSFWMDAQATVWRHRSTGALVPYRARRPGDEDDEDSDSADEQARRAYLKLNFEPLGVIDADLFKENVTALLHHAGPAARVVILLMNEVRPAPDRHGDLVIAQNQAVNAWTRDVAAAHPNVELLNIADFAASPREIGKANHFARMVYVRIYQHVLKTYQSAAP
jgi:hypothetical protein